MPAQHTLADADASDFLAGRCCIRLDPDRAGPGSARAAEDLLRRPDRDYGRPVTDGRSSWVRRLSFVETDCYAKVYDYPTWRDRLRGFGRNTALRPSRARREADALGWLRARGFAAPRAIAVAELRRGPLLRRALLVTEAWPGADLERLWPSLAAAERARVCSALARYVDALHEAGFRDRNLDPRNLLVSRDADGGVTFAKIDSPRFRCRRPGAGDDRLRRQDLARLAAGLRRLESS